MSKRRGRFEVIQSEAGFHVRIVGGNGEPLATSEVLATKAAAEENIDAIFDVVRSGGHRGVQVAHVDTRGEASA